MSQAASTLKLRGFSYEREQFAVRFERYCERYTATASISISQSGFTSAATPTVDRATFAGLVALAKNRA